MAKQAEVRIFGMDSKGKPVNVQAQIVDVSKHGVRLSGVTCWEQPGEIIGIRYGKEKARYRIMWVGKPNSPQAGQIGILCIEGEKYIWDFEPPSAEPPMAAAVAASTPARLSVTPLPPLSSTPQLYERRRKDKRFVVEGTASIRETGKNFPQWTTLHDLSMGGCYVETPAPLLAETRVDILMQVREFKVELRGVVIVKYPLVGMGIKFTEMTPPNREQLRHLIASLERAESQGR